MIKLSEPWNSTISEYFVKWLNIDFQSYKRDKNWNISLNVEQLETPQLVCYISIVIFVT